MKPYFFVLAFVLTFCASCKSEKKTELAVDIEELPLHDKRVLILGNSITQHGYYVDFMEYYLRRQHPENQLDIISIGLSGETISGTSEGGRDFPRPNVLDRLEKALNKTKPDVVLACYGMNDGNYHPLDSLRFQEYKSGILELINKVKNIGAQLILITPTVFDPKPISDRVSMENDTYTYWHPYYNYNQVLTAYSDWLLELQGDGLQVIDMHHYLNSILDKMKRIQADSTFLPDGVHPNKIGHFYMAQKILRNLYPNISVEKPISELERLKVDSLFNLVSKRRKLLSDGWRNYIGYKKDGKTVKSDGISSTKAKVKQLNEQITDILNK